MNAKRDAKEGRNELRPYEWEGIGARKARKNAKGLGDCFRRSNDRGEG